MLLLDSLSLFSTLLVLTLTWHHVWLATALLAVVSTARFCVRCTGRDLAIFGFGFVFASLAEIVQVAAGLYRYSQSCPLVIPYYNFFLWGTVLLTAATFLGILEKRVGTPSATVSWTRLGVENAGYIGITAVLCFGSQHQLGVSVLFSILLGARLLWVRERGNLAFVAVGMLLGPLTEGWLVHLGIYRFGEPMVGNLPLWHPIYWGLIVLYLRPMVRATDELTALIGFASDTVWVSRR